MNRDLLNNRLQAFKAQAPAWFASRPEAEAYHAFFRDFADPEKLRTADWTYFQRLRKRVHAFGRPAIAGANALGKPNHPIEHYRKAFLELIDDREDWVERVRRFTDGDLQLKYFGESANPEIIGQLFPDRCLLYNQRVEWALAELGAPFSKKPTEAVWRWYPRFIEAAEPIVQAYEEVVGPQTDLPIRLEVDQFFSWMYENRQPASTTGHDSDAPSTSRPEVNTSSATRVAWPIHRSARVWLISAGDAPADWARWQQERVVSLGFDVMDEHDEVLEDPDSWSAVAADPTMSSDQRSRARCIGLFAYEMQRGDAIFVRSAPREVVGYGVIDSDIAYSAAGFAYSNEREATWLASGRWVVPGLSALEGPLVELSDTPEQVDNLLGALRLLERSAAEDALIATPGADVDTYSVADACEELFLDPETFQGWLDLLATRKNLVLQGPPGTGKTFVAQRLAWALQGSKDPDRVRIVQFHASYGYEDFVQGYRASGTGFVRKDGVFLRFCNAAREDDARYVLIIDEINRGNLPRIFGELLMLLEADKRDPRWATELAYADEDKDDASRRFYIPDNVYIIGTMNTADRSLAALDHALRRRFAFVAFEPAYGRADFHAWLTERLSLSVAWADLVVERMLALNQAIASERGLGLDLMLGHSPFCADRDRSESPRAWYERIIRTEIAPLLLEYWFDERKRAEQETAKLLAGLDASDLGAA